MSAPGPIGPERAAVHTFTTKGLSLAACCEAYADAGFKGVSVWRDVIEPIGIDEAARIVRGSGLAVPALVRGGFFASADASVRVRGVDGTRRCVDEAATLGAEMVVLVVGAEPGLPLDEARRQVAAGIAEVLPHAEAHGVKLAIEPLHPMYAADRSCINRMAEARGVCEAIRHPLVGIAVDVYHVWWDPDLGPEISAAGENGTLFALHVCDWRVETRSLLTDRGLMGDGVIDIRGIRGMCERAGFGGLVEVEVFSDHYWAMDPGRYVPMIAERVRTAT